MPTQIVAITGWSACTQQYGLGMLLRTRPGAYYGLANAEMRRMESAKSMRPIQVAAKIASNMEETAARPGPTNFGRKRPPEAVMGFSCRSPSLQAKLQPTLAVVDGSLSADPLTISAYRWLTEQYYKTALTSSRCICLISGILVTALRSLSDQTGVARVVDHRVTCLLLPKRAAGRNYVVGYVKQCHAE